MRAHVYIKLFVASIINYYIIICSICTVNVYMLLIVEFKALLENWENIQVDIWFGRE